MGSCSAFLDLPSSGVSTRVFLRLITLFAPVCQGDTELVYTVTLDCQCASLALHSRTSQNAMLVSSYVFVLRTCPFFAPNGFNTKRQCSSADVFIGVARCGGAWRPSRPQHQISTVRKFVVVQPGLSETHGVIAFGFIT